jgi:hypothetical protein
VRLGSTALNTSALKVLSARTSATFSAYGPSAFYVSGGVAYAGTSAGTSAVVTSANSATLWIYPSAAASCYVQSGATAAIRGLTRYYNTSGTNPWVACCSGRIHFGTTSLSSYLTQTFTVDADMEFVTYKDTLLLYNGNERYKTTLSSASDATNWTTAPIMDVLRPWQDRLWCVPTASAYVIRHTSAVGSTEAWSAADYFMVGRQDGGDIVGLEVFQGNLIIFKTTSIYVLVGTAPENYQLEKMTNKGCIAKGSIVVGDTGIIYLSDDGVRLFDGMQSHLISESDDYWLDIVAVMNTARLSRVRGAYHDRKYILAYDDTSASEVLNNYAWVYNFRTNSWTRYSLKANSFFKTPGADEDANLYFGSSVSGVVFKMFSGTTDYASGPAAMSAVISATYKTKAYDLSDKYKDRSNEEKQFLKLSVQGSMNAGAVMVTSEVDSGDGASQTDILPYEGSGGFMLDESILDVDWLGSGSNRFSHENDLGLELEGKTIGLEFKAQDAVQSAEIDTITIGFRDKGNRG